MLKTRLPANLCKGVHQGCALGLSKWPLIPAASTTDPTFSAAKVFERIQISSLFPGVPALGCCLRSVASQLKPKAARFPRSSTPGNREEILLLSTFAFKKWDPLTLETSLIVHDGPDQRPWFKRCPVRLVFSVAAVCLLLLPKAV